MIESGIARTFFAVSLLLFCGSGALTCEVFRTKRELQRKKEQVVFYRHPIEKTSLADVITLYGTGDETRLNDGTLALTYKSTVRDRPLADADLAFIFDGAGVVHLVYYIENPADRDIFEKYLAANVPKP